MIEITPTLTIPEDELQFDFVRAAGPGGQNVNKVSTAVQLRFDVINSPSLPDSVRTRLQRLAGHALTGDGVLIITAQRFRTQIQNRQDAIERLTELLRRAAAKPKSRRKTKPSRSAQARRLDKKRRRSEKKQRRNWTYTQD